MNRTTLAAALLSVASVCHALTPSSEDRLQAEYYVEVFGEFVEGLCGRFYHASLGRPSLTPGIYFRSLLIG